MVYVHCSGVYGEVWSIFVAGEEELREIFFLNLWINNSYETYGLRVDDLYAHTDC